ncbi:MAG: adenosylhomocysteinase [Parcubacteria group bacterium]|nr:adenosylhomocysteinase [Parcubacteria group bacterium]|tara:strand:+ start:9987 stop:11249 length:1263 start_codon:yes stop_codon:yes gene_type:complete
MPHDVTSLKLAPQGKKRIEWAAQDMPVLEEIKDRFTKSKPLKGLKVSCCLHVTAETANLVRVLKAGGANVLLCASNPLSTQDDVAAALVKSYGIKVYARTGEDRTTYYKHLEAALKHKPEVTMDDGADLLSLLHSNKYQKQALQVKGSMEETTTGVIRLQAMEKAEKLMVPIIAVNDAKTKNMFDNRYGTGQSTLDGIIRATDLLLAGKTVVVVGYGWCGRGFAMRARGMGANVIVTEVDQIKGLEAVMDGFRVMPMSRAASVGDLFCTLTGDIHVLRKEHFKKMKDGATICNSGHFDVEIDIPALKKLSRKFRKNVRDFVDEYTLPGNRRIYLLGQGRLINLAAAEGHPASVMDMSFSTQVLATEYVLKNHKKLLNKVYYVPEKIENWIAKAKLKSFGISIDKLTKEQEKYLASWDIGT